MSDEGSPEESKEIKKYSLPHTSSFEEVNDNFDTLSDAITKIMQEMKEHSDSTNASLKLLAEETHAYLNKLASDMKDLLSSQAMMIFIFMTVVGFIVLSVKTIVELIAIYFK